MGVGCWVEYQNRGTHLDSIDSERIHPYIGIGVASAGMVTAYAGLISAYCIARPTTGTRTLHDAPRAATRYADTAHVLATMVLEATAFRANEPHIPFILVRSPA